jgi:DNA helicase-2/ATP-dependent DNA helicase PcrA
MCTSRSGAGATPGGTKAVQGAVEPGGRVLAVGDAGQALYGFAGADYRSMEQITQRLAAQCLPLSICYRCPASHVALAATIQPQIEPRPDAPEGTIEGDVPEAEMLDRLEPGDLVLCRTNAPLVQLTYKLLGRGVPARMRGRDIGKNLCSLVQHVVEQDGFSLEDFPAWVAEYRQQQEEALLRRGRPGVEMALVSLRDRCGTVEEVYRSVKPRSLERFLVAVQGLFGDIDDEVRPVVWLSSVHRAKGDEAPHVYLVRPDLLPHPRARTPQQQEQEQNIRYVAFTRGKDSLTFVGGPVPQGSNGR